MTTNEQTAGTLTHTRSATTVDPLMDAVRPVAPPRQRAAPRVTWQSCVLVLLLFTAGGSALAASRHNSTTFDEIFAVAGGARGYETGHWNLVRYHPRLMQYMYGLPVFLAQPNYPAERGWSYESVWAYSQAFFFGVGNDPERIAFIARSVGALTLVALGLVVFLFVRRSSGATAALLAAGLTVFLPDALAHSGVAYNDVPMAVLLFFAAWRIDAAAREPHLAQVLLAAFIATLAVAMKFTAIALLPIAAGLVTLEAIARTGHRTEYLRRIASGSVIALPVVYLTLVVIYLGDFRLEEFVWGLDFNIRHAAQGHGPIPAWLAGTTTPGGFWYFFPVAFLVKTPAALHLLMLLAALGFARGSGAQSGSTRRGAPPTWLRSDMRMPVLGALVLLAFLLKSNLNIGFRHALPLMPFLIVLVAEGLRRLWLRSAPLLRAVIVALAVWSGASALSFYPHFLTYTSAYNPDRELGYHLLVDSSLDWGQGLLAVRDFMDREGVDRIYLSYFGSALPEAYGIDYVPLPSFFTLPAQAAPEEEPRFVIVSATNLAGIYVNDAFARLRSVEPYRILANSMFVFRFEPEPAS